MKDGGSMDRGQKVEKLSVFCEFLMAPLSDARCVSFIFKVHLVPKPCSVFSEISLKIKYDQPRNTSELKDAKVGPSAASIVIFYVYLSVCLSYLETKNLM